MLFIQNSKVVSTSRAENIPARIEHNPETSLRNISPEVGISALIVWRILHEELLYPYHVQQRAHAFNILDHQAYLLLPMVSTQ